MSALHTSAYLPLDVAVWQRWVEKNRREHAVHFARRLGIALWLSPVALAALCIWLFVR